MAKPILILLDSHAKLSVATIENSAGVVHAVAVAEGAPAMEAAVALSNTLKAQGYTGEGLILGIPSAWCLCASISTERLPRRKQRFEAMLYRLEEKLPLAAEEITADFAPGRDAALGVAVRTAQLHPWLEALEAAGIAIQCISPTVMLSTQGLLEQENRIVATQSPSTPEERRAIEPSDLDELKSTRTSSTLPTGPTRKLPPQVEPWNAVAWCSDLELDCLVLQESQPLAWHLNQAGDPNASGLSLRALRHTDGWRLACCGGTPQAIADLPNTVVEQVEETSIVSAAARAAELILLGELAPWFDLRRGALAVRDPLRQVLRPLVLAASLAAIFLVVLSASLLWRAHQYDRLAAALIESQKSVFRQALPGQAVPGALRSRLQSEEQRMRGLSGDSQEVIQSRSALLVLRDAMSRLPGDVRIRLLEVRIDKDRIYIEGQARTHGDAELIATALRKQGAFEVEPPRTEQLSGQGVSFTITGAVPAHSVSSSEAMVLQEARP